MKIDSVKLARLNNNINFGERKAKKQKPVSDNTLSNNNLILASLMAMASLNSCGPEARLYRISPSISPVTSDMTVNDEKNFDFDKVMYMVPPLMSAVGCTETLNNEYSNYLPFQVDYKGKNKDIVVTYFSENENDANTFWTKDGNVIAICNFGDGTVKECIDGEVVIHGFPNQKKADKKEAFLRYFAERTGCTPDKVKKFAVGDYFNNGKLNFLVVKPDNSTLIFDLNNKKIDDTFKYGDD